jgi:hypothetical protein
MTTPSPNTTLPPPDAAKCWQQFLQPGSWLSQMIVDYLQPDIERAVCDGREVLILARTKGQQDRYESLREIQSSFIGVRHTNSHSINHGLADRLSRFTMEDEYEQDGSLPDREPDESAFTNNETIDEERDAEIVVDEDDTEASYLWSDEDSQKQNTNKPVDSGPCLRGRD